MINTCNEISYASPLCHTDVIREDKTWLDAFILRDMRQALDRITNTLVNDHVALIQGVTPKNADILLMDVARHFGLGEQLEIQANFAAIGEHRQKVGQYFMSVNQRDDYQFIPPHCEGSHASNMQLAALHCQQNTTDGGANILMHINNEGAAWERLKELKMKVDLGGKTPSASEIALAKMILKINLPEDILNSSDEIIGAQESSVPGLKIFDVLSSVKKSYSKILKKDLFAYFDNVASIDADSGKAFYEMQQELNLLKEPGSGLSLEHADNSHGRRVWSSGATYSEIFSSYLLRKLLPGELIIFNNLTWTHSTTNWTPDSGVRKVVAAFA